MKPILFNTEAVKAILDGRKSVTRRVVKPQPEGKPYLMPQGSCWPGYFGTEESPRVFAPPYQRGDTLYVREAFREFCGMLYGRENGTYIPLDDFEGYQYRADNACFIAKGINLFCDLFEDQMNDIRYEKWRPSIHMPKEAARLFLRVTDVRVERLRNIDSEQAVDEGAVKKPNYTKRSELVLHSRYRKEFAKLWDSAIKKSDLPRYGWEANPWVWAIEFERISKEEISKEENV